MKRILTILAATLLLTAAMAGTASASSYDSVAEELSAIGVFRGTAGGFELDRDLLLRIARLAGVREYGYFGDYILPGPQMMITHTTEPGEKTVHFPRVCDVYDYYENRWYEQVDTITKTLDKGKTFLYIYGSRREIEGWNLPVWPGDPI